DGSQGARFDGALAERGEQRVPERVDLPAPERPDTGEPGAIVWRRLGTGHRLEDRAPAQHAGIEPQLHRGTVAGRLEALDPRLERRIAWLARGTLYTRQLVLRERDGATHAIEQRGAMPRSRAGRKRGEPAQLGGRAGSCLGPGEQW